MAWSAPMTAVSGSVFTAAQFNTFVRDNLNETSPAKATTSGAYFTVSGTNEITERVPASASTLVSETTTSTSFTDLTTVGPEVTVDTGASAVLALTRQTAETLGLLSGQTPRTAASIVLGGAVRAQVITAPRVTFAGYTYEDVDVMIFDAARLPGFPKGLLGAGALERFRAILNHAEGAIHLVGG